ncbi:MAG: tRNA (adenosine(37)-N6)-threonylcarbamoyltransferase complex dimerization subunit type 1 TsaB [Chlamydiia bacterium]|nr:tRNA (adenosine(37)-N6)-threonylcarbamoyltransferase complex dimerization subunit type 1 TsaB [Chlamydiia bacterium]
MTRYLVLDTATDCGFAAVYDEDICLARRFTPEGGRNSSSMMQLLEEMRSEIKDLDFIGVGVGPGSYTGVRVGAVIAKMLKLSWKAPLVGISSLAAYRSADERPFYAAFDGRISGAYLSLGGTAAPEALALDLIPVGAHLVSPHISLKKRLEGFDVTFEHAAPDCDAFAREALSAYLAGRHSGDLEMLYLRPTQAELNL